MPTETTVIEPSKTIELSPKTVLAFLYPLLAALAATLASWIITGDFNEAEVRTIVSGFVLSSISGLGAYVGKPGKVVVPAGEVGPASDAVLADSLAQKRRVRDRKQG